MNMFQCVSVEEVYNAATLWMCSTFQRLEIIVVNCDLFFVFFSIRMASAASSLKILVPNAQAMLM